MTRTSFRRVALLVGLTYLTAAGAVVRVALDPGTYFFHTPAERAAWRFPLPVVAFTCVVMLAEAVVVLAALDGRSGRRLWRRAALAATALAVWAVPWAVPWSVLGFFPHALGFLTWHALWVWGLVAFLLAATVGSLAAAGAHWLSRGRRAGRHAAHRAA